nr:DUF817 domain-containing protein [Herbiconiux sp. SYSU D00978]
MTRTERRLDAAARRVLERLPSRGAGGVLVEVLAFGAKQAWACVFGGALLAVLLAARLWYPDDVPLARNDALTLAALAIQLLMLVLRLETPRELRVILLFHVVGTVMELFKTDVGSWTYAADGVMRIGGVPLFSGFMYAAVGSYLVRVYRLFDLRFERYPRQWVCLAVAGLVYLNFFTHHVLPDVRLALFLAVALVWGRAMMHVRVFRARFRMPVLLAFLLVALFIWFAENIATWSDAWSYPDQLDGWQPVSIAKLGSWFLLMIISVALVTWVYPAQLPDAERGRLEPVADSRGRGTGSGE